ncbi:hypothetical protein [Pseudanabaena sp. ABRG5-3]|uniref:hypothetical protein n=1 Tax=Pseudanabaena sp. ABRG5-3 TaxID=685565 RepID=UPI000DC6F2AA|nr:hypothetical protein [Pseudanabaena sp. ABRG5-3]BBC24241.1 hypothetical protein ABRG53_1984 [Pseudanabaena sp. ABRG5-3]
MNANGLEAVLQKDYEVNVEKYFRKGWATLQPSFGPMVGFFLVTCLINVVLAFIPVVGQIASALISAPLGAGYTFVVLAILRGQSFEFNDFFKGLSNKYFLQLFLISLVGGLLIALGFLLLLIPGIYLSVSYVFAVQFAVDWDLEFFQALEASRKLVSRQWLQVFVLLILIGLMNILGVLLLGVGIFVTAPLSICILVSLYNDIAGNTLSSATEEA